MTYTSKIINYEQHRGGRGEIIKPQKETLTNNQSQHFYTCTFGSHFRFTLETFFPIASTKSYIENDIN